MRLLGSLINWIVVRSVQGSNRIKRARQYMSFEKEKQLTPREFSGKKKAEAEFWAWLTEGHVTPSEIAKRSDNSKSERKIIVLSNDEIKDAIQNALSNNDMLGVQELLEIASKPSEGLSKDISRKSVRVGKGEYVKLLYVKTLERTSFADVIVRILLQPCKKTVEELKSKFYGHSFSVANKLDHLMTSIEDWEMEKPESRASIAEWGPPRHSYSPKEPDQRANDWDGCVATEEAKPSVWLNFLYPPVEEIDKIREVFSRFALYYLIMKITDGDYSKPISGLFEEFKDGWKQQIEEQFLNSKGIENVGLRATTDEEDQKLQFTLDFVVVTSFNAKKEQELFDKYGPEEVKEFVNKIILPGTEFLVNGRYEGITNAEEYKRHIDPRPFEESDRGPIYIGAHIEFPCCKATANDPEEFELERISDLPIGFQTDQQQLKAMVLKIATKVGRAHIIEKLVENRKKQEVEDSVRDYAEYDSYAHALLPEAVKKANTPDDYKEINNLILTSNKFHDYNHIVSFSERLIENTLSHYSVVSFYINADLWRLMPLVLEKTNWIALVDEYLKGKKAPKNQ